MEANTVNCFTIKVDKPNLNDGFEYTNAIEMQYIDGVVKHNIMWVPSKVPLFSIKKVEKYELVKIEN